MNNETILGIIDFADSYKNQNDFVKAFYEYEKALPLIVATVVKNKRSKSIGSFAGWSAGFLTGGLGVEDVFLIPLVSKGVSGLLGVDDGFVNQSINVVTLRQLDCLLQSDNLLKIIFKEDVIQKFALLYSSNKKLDVFESILSNYVPELAHTNPFEDPIVSSAAFSFLLEELKKNDFDNEAYNYLLHSYLLKVNDDSELLQYLEKKYGTKNKKEKTNSNQQNNSSTYSKNEDYYYEVLGIKKGASKEEIRVVYVELIKKYHPDKFANLSKEFQDLANKKAQLINEAYNYLSQNL
ncbi:MAG: DnaJ domain-containing protein [Bacteroidetes bacterium]|nr:DnaJ domain-containing protein [Bacteroidota bacterium]